MEDGQHGLGDLVGELLTPEAGALLHAGHQANVANDEEFLGLFPRSGEHLLH